MTVCCVRSTGIARSASAVSRPARKCGRSRLRSSTPRSSACATTTPQINFQGNPTTSPTPLPKPYGMDGAIATYNNSWLYVGMRRGGRVLYAFDVSGFALSSPTAPTLKWKKGCPNQGQYRLLHGLRRSRPDMVEPKIMKVSGYNVSGAGTEKPIVVMGGGYDTCEDADVPTDACKMSARAWHLPAGCRHGAVITVFPTARP